MEDVKDISESAEYRWISNYYGDRTALRSGVRLMDHIDEGLEILVRIGASRSAQGAFCLHPLFQADEDFKNIHGIPKGVDPMCVALTVEYRAVANSYLSSHDMKYPDEIVLSPIREVNQMLVADKLQNYKDFLIYHSVSHPRASILELYFKTWLEALYRAGLFSYDQLTDNYRRLTWGSEVRP